MGKKGTGATGTSDPPQENPEQQLASAEGARGLKQPPASVQDLNESMDSVRNYMLETNREMSQEIT